LAIVSTTSDDQAQQRWNRLVERILPSEATVEADELKEQARVQAATPIADAAIASPVSICGTIRAVTLRPHGQVPAVEAELYDGSGAITLIWLGRRSIRGIDPGRALKGRGRITQRGERRVMFNPLYELLPDRH
jgi:hypothetical protein